MSELNISEMLKAAENAIKSVEITLEHLEKAKSLGAADIAGGMIVISKLKYAEIEKANENENKFEKWFKVLMNSNSREYLDTKLYVEIDESTRILDTYLDNLIVDIAVQSKINDAIREGEAILERLYKIKKRLIELS